MHRTWILCYVSGLAFASALSSGSVAAAQDSSCGEMANARACSYTLINKNCTVTIDRLHPVTPPTIYVRPACGVRVVVNNPYQLEKLTLDWKSTTLVVPPDVFQSVFTSLSANIGKITILGAAAAAAAVQCELTGGCGDPATISRAQGRVSNALDGIDPLKTARPTLEGIKGALQPPPSGGAANPGRPWTDTSSWLDTHVTAIRVTIRNGQQSLDTFKMEDKNLQADIDKLEVGASTPQEKLDVRKLNDNEKVLSTKIASLSAAIDRLKALADGLEEIKTTFNETGIAGDDLIKDQTPKDRNYQTQTWSVNYSNKLLALAKRIAGDSLKSSSAAYVGSLADVSDKQSIVTLTVQFESLSRIELSTGLMVPFTPYHSYTKASDSQGNATVQLATTYGVVPIALLNYRTTEWLTGNQVSAFFLTGGVGVNSATTQVEFGAGVTYSYRSIAISFLADIGRDTNLGGNLMPNGSLGAYTAVPTSTTWVVKPGASLSVRIPLGSGSSTSSSSSSPSGK